MCININLPCELGSGKLSLGTKCITVVLPSGSPSAPNVTLQCKNLPWYINRKISAFETISDSQSEMKRNKYFVNRIICNCGIL